jgi:hypothetical protein
MNFLSLANFEEEARCSKKVVSTGVFDFTRMLFQGDEHGKEKQEYEKRPRFGRVDTSWLWEEYQAQREMHKALRQAKLVSLAASRALQVEGVKAAARAK